MNSFASEILGQLDELLYPKGVLCLKCGVLSKGKTLCTDCEKVLKSEIIDGKICHRCGHPLKKDGTCGFCHFLEDRNIILRAPYLHRGLARELVHMLKYNNISAAADALSPAMAEAASKMGMEENTVATWVTMPEKRLKQRGIDHGRTLCEDVAGHLQMRCEQLLDRENKKVESTQQGQNLENRQKNLQGMFHPRVKIDFPVLLIDDVTTTGSTLITCYDALKEAGCTKMYALTATLAGIDYIGASFSDEYAPW